MVGVLFQEGISCFQSLLVLLSLVEFDQLAKVRLVLGVQRLRHVDFVELNRQIS